MSGIFVGLPIVAGPILFITYLQHGSSFAAGAAKASLLGLVSLALFAVVFARISRRLGWWPTLTAGWAATLVADVCLSQLHVPAVAGLALTVSATLTALWLLPRAKTAPVLPTAPNQPWWDLPGRATATGVLVLTITTASSAHDRVGDNSSRRGWVGHGWFPVVGLPVNNLSGGEAAGKRLGSADGWVVSPCWVTAQCGSASEDSLERCGCLEAG
jgi:hypothetical protein